MRNRPKVGVGVIIKRKNKVLIGKRIGDHAGGYWGFVGGHLEFGEEIDNCVKREVAEEVGIEVENIKFVTITNDIFGKNNHYVTIFVTCDYKSGSVKNLELERCAYWKWLEWEKLPEPLFLPIQNLLNQSYNPFL